MNRLTPGRIRSNTIPTDNAFAQEKIKRKREEEETLKEIFNKPKKTIRSPTKEIITNRQSETEEKPEMDELTKLIKEMKVAMEQGFKNNNEELKNLRKELKETEEKWKKEKTELEDRITKLENRMRQKDRDERRNNIVIKGIKIKETNIEAEVEKMLQEKIGVEVKIREAYKIAENRDKDIVLAKLEQRKHKTSVMINKGKLRGENWYIEDDLTKEEQEIQREIVKRAKEERKRGLRATIGYRKLNIDGKKYTWSDAGKCLLPVKEQEIIGNPKNE